MDSPPSQVNDPHLADAWADLQAQTFEGDVFEANANRLAFADPEFLLRRETRGIRFQLEMLKPDLAQQAAGIESTVVVFGSARFCSPELAERNLRLAQDAGGDAAPLKKAQQQLANAKYYQHAQDFARLVARYSQLCSDWKSKLTICTGGGPGIMEAANRGAWLEGAPTVGLNIALPHEQQPNPYITPNLSFKFHYFALRKMHFLMRAKALVAFPGGFGTLDELFEVLTLVQCKKARPVPIVLFGTDYWQRLLNLQMLVDEGAIDEADLELFTTVDTPDAAWQVICNFYNLSPSPTSPTSASAQTS